MANLIAQTPLRGQDAVTIGSVTLTEIGIDAATSVTALKGQVKAVSEALKSQIGIGLPGANRSTAKGAARALWTGPDRALVLGAVLAPIPGAVITDQGDGMACVEIAGAGAEAVLARLVPLDLRTESFKKGHTARSFVNHMTASITRTGADRFEVMVMRSMAQTLWHELTEAAQGVAAR